MLAEAVGNFGELALVGADGAEIINLADEKEGAEGLPDLVVAGIDGSDFGARGDMRIDGDRKRSNAAADRRTDFDDLVAVLRGIR